MHIFINVIDYKNQSYFISYSIKMFVVLDLSYVIYVLIILNIYFVFYMMRFFFSKQELFNNKNLNNLFYI